MCTAHKGEALEEIQSISQFVLEDGRIFRTWIKYTDIIKACKELFEDAVDWQFQKGIINEERKRKSLESLKIVELAEQQSYVEHGHGGHWNAPNYQVEDVIYIDMKECYPASIRGQGECSPWFKQFGHLTYHFVQVAVEGELPSNDITGFVQQFLSGMENILPVEMEKNVGRQKQTKGWLPKNWDISCAIIEKFTQGNKVKEKRLIHQVVIDEGELNFLLIQDCIKEGTYASSDKYLLEHILTYYEGHQP
ncbi:hypothetical protein RhiirA1_477580 [Rhizophagus irregularis]|uniref:Uncharacterized protein n=1 Tax=Rhizophagus irregularis TaxID=588596 RepID=A0A2N0QTD0_9GLOM|nr:hypothetical protein RhiirA1_477580 [Rhizophagus irregularis]